MNTSKETEDYTGVHRHNKQKTSTVDIHIPLLYSYARIYTEVSFVLNDVKVICKW